MYSSNTNPVIRYKLRTVVFQSLSVNIISCLIKLDAVLYSDMGGEGLLTSRKDSRNQA